MLARCGAAAAVALSGAVAIAWDAILLRNTEARRAVHLRRMFERLGGAFLVIGRQIGAGLELLQSPYGDELSRIVDRMAPFPVADAIVAVERASARPLEETFAQFDPEPIASRVASCTYQAVLRSGEKVVAQVRRPGIGERVVADLAVLDCVAWLLEALTVVKPGATRQALAELRESVLEQLDFVREARHQDAFRRAARKDRQKYFTAPRVYFALSDADVTVQEFVSGMWLWELLAAVEQNNADVLRLADSLGIDARKVSKRLLRASYWTWHESLFFLADPRPDTIILAANGVLSFTDFTATAAIDRSKRRALLQNMHFAVRRDPLNMARCSIQLLEPLPPVDALALTKELESFNWQMLYALEAKGLRRPWVERTTTRQWSGLATTAREFGVAIEYRVLQLMRAAILHESIAVRLDETVDVVKEFRRFTRRRAKRTARSAVTGIGQQLRRGIDKSAYLTLEQVADTAETLMLRLRHGLTAPRVNFRASIGKGAFAFMRIVRFGAEVSLALLAGGGFYLLSSDAAGRPVDLRTALASVAQSRGFLAVAVLLLVVNARVVLFRLDDKDA
jgi:predicted unusual protein kinase regulating ubiquinone biosynthesis (AarF/ABC1/UbiB family)